MAIINLQLKQLAKKPKNGARLENATPLLQLANRYLAWLLILPVFIIMVVSYLYLLSPKLATLQDKSQNLLPSKRTLLEDLQSVKQDLDDLDTQFKVVRINKAAELDKIYEIIPTEPDYASLFVQAEFLAESHQLELLGIEISKVLEAPVATREGQATAASVTSLPANLRSLAINFQIGAGTYQSFKDYLDALERNLRLFDIQSISFGSVDQETEEISRFSLNLRSYYQIDVSQ